MSLQQTLTFILTEATLDDFDRIHHAINSRRDMLADINAASLTSGSRVTIRNIRPKELDGALGVIVTLSRGRGKPRADVRLDATQPSGVYLRKYYGSDPTAPALADGRQPGKLVIGVPLSCLVVHE